MDYYKKMCFSLCFKLQSMPDNCGAVGESFLHRCRRATSVLPKVCTLAGDEKQPTGSSERGSWQHLAVPASDLATNKNSAAKKQRFNPLVTPSGKG
jgi:hypothetical protein